MVKVSIIGPLIWAIGGHDANTPERIYIRSAINNILSNLQNDNDIIIGLTSLSLSIEQDFTQLLLENKIDYKVYLPYEHPQSYWKHLPTSYEEKYNELLNNAIQIIISSDGQYSPKKIMLNKNKIIKESDVIIYVHNKKYFPYKFNIENKIVHHIYV